MLYCDNIPDTYARVRFRFAFTTGFLPIMPFHLGNVSGSVSLRDPRTLKEEHKFSAHTETLSDFDVHNNFLVTCGFSSR